jgi:hypothetical protein
VSNTPSDPVTKSAKDAARGDDGMFPMRLAAQLTGLTPDTIRAWERRYKAVEPVRTAGNTRKFRHSDIRRLLMLREAVEAGHSIGNIAGLNSTELRRLGGTATLTLAAGGPNVGSPLSAESVQSAPLMGGFDRYFELLDRFDVLASDQWVRQAAALRPPKAFALEVVSLLLGEIQDRRADARIGGPPDFVAVGPMRQRHSIAGMAAVLLARAAGHSAYFLGGGIPDADALLACDAIGAATVLFDLSAPTSLELIGRSRAMLERMSERVTVWVMVPPGHGAVMGELVTMSSLAAVDEALRIKEPG